MGYFTFTSTYPGLKVWCAKCGEWIKDTCTEDGKPIKNCISSDNLRFRMHVHKPGTKKGKWTHVLEATTLDDAISEAITFKKRKLGNVAYEYIIESVNNGNLPPITSTIFSDALAKYVGIKHGEGLYSYEKKDLTPKYLKDTVRYYEFLADTLLTHHDLSTFTINEFLTKEVVDEVYKAMESSPPGENTFNKRLDCYRRFEEWVCTDLHLPFLHLFWGIDRKTETYTPEAITEKEFDRLLPRVTYENGIKNVNYSSKKTEYYYRPWLSLGFRLALATGGRREEITSLKFCDIELENGEPLILWMENFKVNRKYKLVGKNKEYIPVAVSKELEDILIELDYKKYLESDRYILAPEITENRKTMWDALTKGFHHYYSQLNTGRNLTFYSLKRANITAQHIRKDKRDKPSHHADEEVEIKHYVDKQITEKHKKGYLVFPAKKNGLPQ